MNKNACVITVLDSITETSMPFNEFVLYRAVNYKNELHIVLVCELDTVMPEMQIPENVRIYNLPKNTFVIRKTVIKLIKKLQNNNIPYIIHLHQPQSAFWFNISMFGTHIRKKVLFTVHSTFTGYAVHNKILSAFNSLCSYKVTCVSKSSYNGYSKILKKIKGEYILPIQNGTDLERIDNVLKLNTQINSDEHKYKRFIYVARMVEIKNHDFLLDVISKINGDAKFIFIGAEDAKGEIRKKAEELGLKEKVEFVGLIPRNDVYKYLESADVYISPSKLEGLPISVLEAMYIGLPVVLSDIEPHKEIAEYTEAVRILPLEDINAWVAAIDEYIKKQHTDLIDIGKKSKMCVEKEFSLKTMHQQYSVLYEEILQIKER
ncbi:MAG: glycosyltransferase family 4 protein [Lachnospiraceae bacterium]|nr:glycosyltransferase family 4 protein [Lachnospiraceae bacterium]